jgi:membrane fusion protein (multidrug efflux system)
MFITRRMVGLVVIVLTFASCNSKKEPQTSGGGARRPQGPIQVDGFVVKQSSISEKIEVPGSLLPFEETALRAEVGGRVVQL